MIPHLNEIWLHLSASPLPGLIVTLLAYQFASLIYARSHFNPLANPVAIAVIIVVSILTITRTSYSSYFQGAQYINFLLGPATVALAIPLFLQLGKIKKLALPLLAGLVAGALTAIISATGIAWMLGASRATILSLAPKSVTTPIAIGISEKIGGLPALTAALVILAGIIGAIIGGPLLKSVLGIRAQWISGFAMGTASHGIGTARAFQISEEMGAFSGLAMGLNGLATSAVMPILLAVLTRYWPG